MKRRHKRIVTAAATAAVASSFNPAAASPGPGATFNANAPRSAAYKNQRAAHDPILADLAATAVKFWAARGVTVPANVALDVADDLTGAAGVAFDPKTYGDARVILDGRAAGTELARARNKRVSVRMRREAIQRLGQEIAHEMGHVSGIEHSPSGLMMPAPTRANVPWDVKVLARKLVPDEPKRRTRKATRTRPIRGGSIDW